MLLLFKCLMEALKCCCKQKFNSSEKQKTKNQNCFEYRVAADGQIKKFREEEAEKELKKKWPLQIVLQRLVASRLEVEWSEDHRLVG